MIDLDRIVERFSDLTKNEVAGEELKIALRSFHRKRYFARYHAEEILIRFNSIADAGVDKLSHFLVHTTNSEETEEKTRLNNIQFEIHAHTYAYAGSMHSIADILARAAFIYFDLKRTWSGRTLVTLSSVSKHLELTNPNAFVERVNELTSDREFAYLSGFNNCIKHYELVSTDLPFSAYEESKAWVGFRIKEFKYKNMKYPERLLNEFLREGYPRVSYLYCNLVEALQNIVPETRPN